MKLNGTHQLVVCGDDVNSFGQYTSISTTKMNILTVLEADQISLSGIDSDLYSKDGWFEFQPELLLS
jgi:hypothetical protein